MLGKALYDRILVENQFSEVLLNALRGVGNVLDDLKGLDEELYRGLISMKAMGAAEVASLGLTFETERHEFGAVTTAELVLGGSTLPVTIENVGWYIHRLAHYKLNEETRQQSRAFLRGFHELITLRWIRMFSPRELQLLIGGDQSKIDISDMRRLGVGVSVGIGVRVRARGRVGVGVRGRGRVGVRYLTQIFSLMS